MSSISTSSAAASSTAPGFGQSDDTSQDITPPLLPAFLITGLFMCVAVCLMGWRYVKWHTRDSNGLTEGERLLLERRRRYAEMLEKNLIKQKPQLLELWVDRAYMPSKPGPCWNDILPLSATVVNPPADANNQSKNDPTNLSHMQVACIVSMPRLPTSRPDMPRDDSESSALLQDYVIGVEKVLSTWKREQ